MRTLAIIFALFCTVAVAETVWLDRQGNPHFLDDGKDFTGQGLVRGREAGVVVTITTNIVVKPQTLIALEAQQEGMLRQVGGSCTNSYEKNLELCAAAATEAIATTNSFTLALVNTIGQNYAVLKAMGSKFDPLIGSYTNIVSIVTTNWMLKP